MSRRRVILEMGMGNDLHGADYGKAAARAIDDALRHSSLLFVGTLGVDAHRLEVDVTIGVQRPELVDTQALAARLPLGRITVRVKKGGLDVPGETDDQRVVIASAAVEVWLTST